MSSGPRHLLLGSLMLGGCVTVGPDYVEPQADVAPAFQEVREDAGLRHAPAQALPRWWHRLDDPLLGALVDQAVARNLDVQVAESRLRQARAERGIAFGARLPALGVGAGVQRSGTDADVGNAYAIGFDAVWEADLFGGKRRAVEAADASVQAREEALRDVLVSVLAEVALNYVDLRSQQELLRIAQENLGSQQQNLQLVESQLQAGLIEQLAYEQARGNLENTRAQIPTLQTGLERARNRLSTLLDQRAGALDAQLAEPMPVPKPPVEVAIGIPAEMLRRRPDVRLAERNLAVATANVGVATAQRYPELTLNGSLGLESLSSGDLFQAVSRTFGIGALVDWTLFSGGQLRAQVQSFAEQQQQAALAWEGAVRVAVEETENALTAYANEQLRFASLEQSAAAAAKTAELARSRYDAGLTTFLEVLDADRSRLAAESNLASSRALITTNLIRLYKALGGGWESLRPAATDAAP